MPAVLYGLAYSETALTFLQTIPAKFRRQIVKKVEALPKDPYSPGHKLLRGSSDDDERVYRVRSGDYRVLYVVRSNPDQIVVLDIDHRKDIYR